MAVVLDRRPLCAGGPEVTVLGFGALEIGRDWGLGTAAERERPSEQVAGEVLRAVLDAGINLVDTASAYHRSEERIGRALAGRRAEYVLATKCGEHSHEPGTHYDFSYGAIAESISRSLERLQTDTLDLLQIHFGPEPERVLDAGETVRAMRQAQEAGRVRHLGASCGTGLARRCIESGDFQVLQLTYNLLDRGAEAAIALAAERGIGILLKGPLAGGWLTPRAEAAAASRPEMAARLRPYLDLLGGDYGRLPALALAFCRHNPGVSSILAGSKSVEHVRRNVDTYLAGVPEGLLREALAVR